MAKTAVVRARTEPELKEHVEKILEGLGIKPSEAINMFYRQIKRAGGLPFEISNARTVQELEEDMYRLKECRAGHYIEHDKVDAWLRTIGTDDELPCPSK